MRKIKHAHVLIAGQTLSGKTTLAKQLSAFYARRDRGVLVLDPIRDPGWTANYLTDSGSMFLRVAKRSWECALFIDESGETVGRYNAEMQWLATQSRHRGHRAHFLTQRPAQLSPTVRHQCTRLLLFAVNKKDARTLADEWNEPQLLEAPSLQQGEFFDVTRFGKLKSGRVF